MKERPIYELNGERFLTWPYVAPDRGRVPHSHVVSTWDDDRERTTLCGITTPDWWDGGFMTEDGPTCSRCRKSLAARAASPSPTPPPR